MKNTILIIISASIIIILIGIFSYFAMDDLGLFDGSYEHSTLAKVSSYFGAGFTAIKLWTVWERFMWFVKKVLTWGFIIFVILGIGIVLGF